MAKRLTDSHWPWQWMYYDRYDQLDGERMTEFMKSGYKISQVVSAYINFVIEYRFEDSIHSTY